MTPAKLGAFSDLLALTSASQQPIAERLRQIILETNPEACEVVRLGDGAATYGLGPRKMIEGFVYIMPYKSWVNLGFYQGTGLPDPAGVLEGSGAKMRHVRIRSLAEAERPTIRALIAAAVEERRRALGRPASRVAPAPAADTHPTTIDAYIRGFPPDVRAILEKTRATIRKAAPGAEETIRYRIPTFTLHGNLVHFAAYQRHIGFYPTSSGITQFKRELAGYASARGSVQFPLDQPIPYGLIARIVKFRVKENRARAAAKAAARRGETG